jgi:hypothetical protein
MRLSTIWRQVLAHDEPAHYADEPAHYAYVYPYV